MQNHAALFLFGALAASSTIGAEVQLDPLGLGYDPFPKFEEIDKSELYPQGGKLSVAKDGSLLVDGKPRYFTATIWYGATEFECNEDTPGYVPELKWLYQEMPDYEAMQRIGLDAGGTEAPLDWMRDLYRPWMKPPRRDNKRLSRSLANGLPVYVDFTASEWSHGSMWPHDNPLDPDITLKDALEEAPDKKARDSIKTISEDYSRRKTISINNAGITKRGEKPRPWDLANFSVNYTFNEVYRSNTRTEIDLERNYKGGINYNYEAQPKNIMPFRNVKFLNSPIFRIIKDFNFYPFPKSISFRTDIGRYYNEVKTRNINNPNLLITPTFRKDFEWTRMFDVKYDLTRQLKIDFTSTNIARIDEPEGAADRRRYQSDYENWRDSVMNNIKRFGRTTSYNHYQRDLQCSHKQASGAFVGHCHREVRI